MTDAHGHDAAYPISWSAPDHDDAVPAWSGPRPDQQAAPQSAPQGGQLGAGWPGGEQVAAADQQPQQEAQAPHQEQHHAQTGGQQELGWMPQEQAAPSGASRVDAYDMAPQARTPDAYQQQAPQAPEQAPISFAKPQEHEPEPPAYAPHQQEQPANAPQGYGTPYPDSYAPAPNGGLTGMRSGYPSAPQGEVPQQMPAAYTSAAPEVIGQNDDLPEDSLSIGRSRSNSIVLDDMLVSRRHVVITADEEGLLLRDLGSRNGTFVNGRRVEQTHLHEGDKIGIGASTFEVRDGWLVSV